MFASDRDLLILEPSLFRDAGLAGQRLVRGTGTISGGILTLSAQDNDFEAAGVGAGHVVLVDGASYEVLARLSPDSVSISRLRAGASDPALPPSAAAGKPVDVYTFAPQIASVHRVILRMLGIEPDDPADLGLITEADITNAGALALIEATGAIHEVYATATIAAAGGPGGWAHPVWSRMQLYRERFEHERQRAVARIDTDGDGLPDATRRMNVIQLMRA